MTCSPAQRPRGNSKSGFVLPTATVGVLQMYHPLKVSSAQCTHVIMGTPPFCVGSPYAPCTDCPRGLAFGRATQFLRNTCAIRSYNSHPPVVSITLRLGTQLMTICAKFHAAQEVKPPNMYCGHPGMVDRAAGRQFYIYSDGTTRRACPSSCFSIPLCPGPRPHGLQLRKCNDD